MGEPPGTLAGLNPLAFSPVPLAGPVLWRLQDAPPGTPAIAWGEVPRHQLRGHLTHYTVYVQSGTKPTVCMNGEFHRPAPKTHPSVYPALIPRLAPLVPSRRLGKSVMSSVP